MWPFSNHKAEATHLIEGFLPHDVVQLIRSGRCGELSPTPKEATVLFAEISDYSNIAQDMTLDELFIFLKDIFGVLEDSVRINRGLVDKFNGDSMMAIWNVPEDCPSHQYHACIAALQLQEAIPKIFRKAGIEKVPAVHVGINSGKVVAGVFQFGSRSNFTAFGDEVNIASRLVGIAKFFGTPIGVTETVYLATADAIIARELALVRVRENDSPLKIFEILSRQNQLPMGWDKALPSFQSGLEHWRQKRFKEAGRAFEDVLQIFPGDGPSQYYQATSARYLREDFPSDWDGSFNVTSKPTTIADMIAKAKAP